MATSANVKSAVVFSGGGAYGAYEVGVLKALAAGESPATGRKPLAPQVATGTSVGAFNAALLAMYAEKGSGEAADQMEQVWMKEVAEVPGRGNGVFRFRANPLRYLDTSILTNPSEIMDGITDAVALTQDWSARLFHLAAGKGTFAQRSSDLLDISSLISVDPFEQMLRRVLKTESIARSPLALAIVATNWKTGQTKTFGNHDIDGENGASVIMASAAIPGIFPPVKIENESYVDGGVVLNTPLSIALNAGATELHVIYMSPDIRTAPIDDINSTIDTFDRVYHIMLETKISEDIATARWINEGIELLRQLSSKHGSKHEPTTDEQRTFVRVANVIYKRTQEGSPYKPVTIHRYYPKQDLGDPLTMLNFAPERLRMMIEMGFTDTRDHDCQASGCVLAVNSL
ncbi:MAG: patatin-like phospholipase family protein [Bryobacteraceae bacterium]